MNIIIRINIIAEKVCNYSDIRINGNNRNGIKYGKKVEMIMIIKIIKGY